MNENITLKIDNREISVPKGTTILEAARELGIDIPTLCYMNLHQKRPGILPYLRG